VEKRIANIRAMRDGTGVSLTEIEARALAGEWYEFHVAKHSPRVRERWQAWDMLLDDLDDEVQETLTEDELRYNPELARDDEFVQAFRRGQRRDREFLASKGLVLSTEARRRFLSYLYDDFRAALKTADRLGEEGDYGPDDYAKRFPKRAPADTGIAPWDLFQNWVAAKQPAQSTVESWRYVFLAMRAHFAERSAGSITADDAETWIKGLISEERSAGLFGTHGSQRAGLSSAGASRKSRCRGMRSRTSR